MKTEVKPLRFQRFLFAAKRLREWCCTVSIGKVLVYKGERLMKHIEFKISSEFIQ